MRHRLRRTGLVLFSGGLAALLVGPFLIPVPPLKGTHEPHELGDEDSGFIDIHGLDIHVKKMGQGDPAFLLLHGFAASLYSWQVVMQPLSQLGTVIAYDRPGFGLSERPLKWQGRNPYRAEAQVELVVGLMDHFGVQRAILVGSSAGGTVAAQAALAYPERVSALILVDAAIYIAAGTFGWIQPILATPQMRHLGPLMARQILRFGPELISRAWHDPTRLTDEMMDLYQKPFQVNGWDKALWEITLASHGIYLPERLDELTLPILVVTGDDDRIVPTSDSIRLARELPNASLEVIADCGHLPHEEQPDVFLEALTRFINEL